MCGSTATTLPKRSRADSYSRPAVGSAAACVTVSGAALGIARSFRRSAATVNGGNLAPVTTYPDPDDDNPTDDPAGTTGSASTARAGGRGTSLPDPVTGRRGSGPVADEPDDDPDRVDTTVTNVGDPTDPPAVAGRRWQYVAGTFVFVFVAIVLWVILSPD